MALSADKLAKDIQAALGQGSQPLSDQNKKTAKAIVDHVTSRAVLAAAIGGVVGTCPPGGPLAAGAIPAGTLSGLDSSSLAKDMEGAYGGSPTSQVEAEADAIVKLLQGAVIVFSPGAVVGACANSDKTPGPFIGSGSGGKITAISGAQLAGYLAPSRGGKITDTLQKKCDAIANHFLQLAEGVFPSGVTGTAPPGGGALQLGVATGGLVR